MKNKEFEPAGMVRWYDPLQLLHTARQVVISTLFAEFSDQRLIQAISNKRITSYDYSRDETNQVRDELWFDYVADTGDGWNPTYAVAYWLSQPALGVCFPGNKESPREQCETKRGDFLILGGDEVYPTASRSNYKQRLILPYQMALPCRKVGPQPTVFAIPGNHDWYDNLVSFTNLFSYKYEFAGWRTQQEKSYFALKLPHGWWLCGVDIQLRSDIDHSQLEYFKEIATKEMNPDDRVLLCIAEPHWVYSTLYGKYSPDIYNETNITLLEEQVFGRKISVFVAGDLHHYRRHANSDGIQKIIAGGGGAFLHPTHGQNVKKLSNGFESQGPSYPKEDVSRKLAWGNLGFFWLNPMFGLVTGFFYVMTAWSVMADIYCLGPSEWFQAITITINSALQSPTAFFWCVALFLGIWLFTDTHSKPYRLIAGTVHGLTHLLAVFFLGWTAAYYCIEYLELEFKSTGQLIATGVLIGLGGYFIGPFIMGVYLLVSLNVFKRHSNEAFSSLRIEDWKSFLRFHIDSEGTLTIYPIGIGVIPRRWKHISNGSGTSEVIPDDPKATAPELIEPGIRVPHARLKQVRPDP